MIHKCVFGFDLKRVQNDIGILNIHHCVYLNTIQVMLGFWAMEIAENACVGSKHSRPYTREQQDYVHNWWWEILRCISRGYPAKRALSAMRKYGG